MNSKKGSIVMVYAALIFLLFFGFMFMFFSSYMFEAGGEYIIKPVVNASLTQAQSMNISSELQTVITDTQTNYYSTELPYDILFFAGVASLFLQLVYVSYKTRKAGFFSVFGVLTIGNAIFFSILYILQDVKDWLFDTFFFPIFGSGYISTPLIDAVYNNYGVFALSVVGVIILINQFDADILNRNAGRFEE